MPAEVVRPPRKWARPLLALSIGLLVLLVVAPLAGEIWQRRSQRAVRLNVADIPRGYTTMSLDGLAAVVSREGDDIVVLAGREPHLTDQLVMCPNSQTLVGTNGSSQYDRHGIKHGGPAPRSLDRFASERDGDVLVVHPDQIEYRDVWGQLLPARPGPLPPRPPLPWSREWASTFVAGTGFCPPLQLPVRPGT